MKHHINILRFVQIAKNLHTGGKMKEKNKIRGKKARASGARFELRVRKDLESKGWVVDKWSNNVELPILKYELKGQYLETDFKFAKLIPAKRKYNGPGRPMAIGTGFPDFIVFKIGAQLTQSFNNNFSIQTGTFIAGVEAKSNGYLDKVEKEKCKWLLSNNKFSKILIASKGKKRGEIIYKEFKK